MRRRILKEGNVQLELAVVKCLTGANLTVSEFNEVCELAESDLMRDYGCDLYMAETVKLHAKKEMLRLRAQHQWTPLNGLQNNTGYPVKPFTRTDYIKESRKLTKEGHGSSGRMMDYGHQKSDSDEGRMMKQSLRDIAVDAYRLHQLLEDGDDLPQWCQYKTAQAQQMLGSVRDYLEYELERGGEDPVGEKEMFDPNEMEEDFENAIEDTDVDLLHHDERDVSDDEDQYEEDFGSDEQNGYDAADIEILPGR